MDVENARTEAHETRHHKGCAYRSGHRQDVRRTRMLLKPQKGMLTSNLMPIMGAVVKPKQTTKVKEYIPHNKADFWWLTMANGSKLKGYKRVEALLL